MVSASTEYKQNHSSGPELISLRRKEREKMLLPPNPNELHVINKCEQLPYSTCTTKIHFILGRPHIKHSQLQLPIIGGVSISDKTGPTWITQECRILLCFSLFCCNFLPKQLFLSPSILNGPSQHAAELHYTRKWTLPSSKDIQNTQKFLLEPSNHS